MRNRGQVRGGPEIDRCRKPSRAEGCQGVVRFGKDSFEQRSREVSGLVSLFLRVLVFEDAVLLHHPPPQHTRTTRARGQR